ncbi:hypothetical protein [Dethiosulfatarculus sandiegensis]|uniref:Uncharacterized protein n=1 Tax=Dethiosulfatarculus sandiegensis TaxID=1429043 RepID=A0A0D2GGH0_9BACT|nr:hypothetical protein [Dethiosulfatarculus sandiegensis]KIX13992.1 hypothetical protein X474_12980 [Dethiosulfatarculus sandiegensis]
MSWSIKKIRLSGGRENLSLCLAKGDPIDLARVWAGVAWPGEREGAMVLLAQSQEGKVWVLDEAYSLMWQGLAAKLAVCLANEGLSRVYHQEDDFGLAFRERVNRYVREHGLTVRDGWGGRKTIPFSDAPFWQRPEFAVQVVRDWFKPEQMTVLAGAKRLKDEIRQAAAMSLEEAARAWEELPGWQGLCHCLGGMDVCKLGQEKRVGEELWEKPGDERTGF